MDREKIKRCLEEIGIAFLFAPNLHTAMKRVMPARKQIAGKTMFNILGPLINPARATNQLIGVYSREWTNVLAQVLYSLGTQHVLVVCGRDGLDEVTTTDETFISELNSGEFKEYEVSPEGFGFQRARLQDLSCSGLREGLDIARDVLNGQKGRYRDIVLFNAGCAIFAANKVSSIKEGIASAAESIDSGKALGKLELLKQYSRQR